MDAPRRRDRLAAARLYLVTESGPPAHDLRELLGAALAGGVDVVQLRDKDAPDEEILRSAEVFRAACEEHDALFVVNDRPDLALAAGADGVHVGQEDEPVDAVRERVGRDLLIGLSTHSPAQFDAGLDTDADYLCAGPVWETPTKEGRPATGLGYLRHAAARADRPWFAIGGIGPDNVGEVVRAGAGRAVVVRAVRDARDPRAAAEALRGALESREGARAGT